MVENGILLISLKISWSGNDVSQKWSNRRRFAGRRPSPSTNARARSAAASILRSDSLLPYGPDSQSRDVHRDLFGYPTKILVSLSSLMLVIQAITGYYMWWKKLRFRQSREEAVKTAA